MEDRIADVVIKAEIVTYNLKKSGEFKESDHPRADDGKFGGGGGSSSPKEPESQKTHFPWEPESSKVEFSPAAHTMAKTILSRTNKERTKDINTLAKMPKNHLKAKASKIQDQINAARERHKKDPDNPKWSDIMEALSRMHGDVTAALEGS